MPKSDDHLPLVWNKPINPAADRDFGKKSPRPVTIRELGGPYQTAGLRYVPVKGKTRTVTNAIVIETGTINLPEFRRALEQWNNQKLAQGCSSQNKLEHNFGKCLWLNYSFFKTSDWKKAIDEIARQKLFLFDTWGAYPLPITPEMHAYVTKKLGVRFLGWDIGEQDGLWFYETEQVYPATVDRQEGWRNFKERQGKMFEAEHQSCTPLCSLTYPHYYLEMGARMIGAEFLQGLPSTNMWAAFIRGAARQYQVVWFAGTSVWNRFGWKNFSPNRYGASHADHQSGPDHGSTLALIEQVWRALYSYGVNIQAMEAGQFYRPPGTNREYISPFGEMQLQWTKKCHAAIRHRGVQHCPVALLLDFHSGWAPPRHIYSDSLFNTWGTIPYEPGDHQIDLFFREAFPEYQDCPFFRNGRGALTATPHGDIFDVLLSNAREDILFRYGLVCVLGETRIEGELLIKLMNYVKQGGEVIWSYHQLSDKARRLIGLVDNGLNRKGKSSVDTQTSRKFPEEPFTYPDVTAKKGFTRLASDCGKPLLVACKIGKGKIITIIPPFGMGNKKQLPGDMPLSYPNNVYGDWDADVNFLYLYWEKPLGTPYQFLNGVRKIWFEYVDKFNLIEITASDVPGWNDEQVVEEYGLDPGKPCTKLDIMHITCLRENPAKLVVTLINTNLVSIYGRLKVKHAGIVKARDIMDDTNAFKVREDGLVNFHLKPKDFSGHTSLTLELTLDRPVVKFMK